MRWRLLHGDSAEGARQMAVDEALFESALGSESLATVRLYRFRRPTLSFGYGQRLEEVCRPEACRALGVDWVRRPTGGRALLHQHELTYAVTAPARDVFARLSVHDTYAIVRASLASALAGLGVPLDPIPPSDSPPRGPSPRSARWLPCLAAPERHELTSGGRKVVASAQRRRRGGFLQHGSILLSFDASLWRRVRPVDDERPLEAVGIDELLGRPPGELALRNAVASAFEEVFDEPPAGLELTALERTAADRLEVKYRSEAWTRRLSPATVDNSQAAW